MFRRGRSGISILVAFGALCLCSGRPLLGAQITYLPTAADFANPERGFYRHWETLSSAPSALPLAALVDDRVVHHMTLILRLYYLDTFAGQGTPISPSFLQLIENDLATLRAAGVKCVLRFAYAQPERWPPAIPYGDADKTTILAQLQQLEPILRANADVIAVVHAGFIGLWGEWYYTDHFGDAGVVSPQDWTERREVLTALLDLLPPVRKAQVRTPDYKQTLFQTADSVPRAEALEPTYRSRTGFHNDCFLASDDDFGTYVDGDDRPFLAAETTFFPMGGETCNPNPPRSECTTALAELDTYHWSYLNADYHPDVLASWVTGGCMDEVRKRLGYRLALQQGTYDAEVRPGDQFHVSIGVENDGFAAPFSPRLVQLLLRKSGSGALYGVDLPDDPRLWLPGGTTYVVDHAICVPSDLPAGTYELLLALPDLYPALRGRPEYAILFANGGGVQEPTTGFNDLQHAITVSPTAVPSPCASPLSLVPFDALGSLPPGRVPRDRASGRPLTLGKNSVNPTALDLSWGLSCSPGATDYAVMEGTLGSWSSHVSLVCSTGGATSITVSPGSGASHYYVVVPLSATEEGSYGVDSTGAERPPSAAPCRRVQNTVGCP